MQTSVERLDDTRVRLTVTVPASDVDREIAAAYARIGAKLRVPGFRPGKAPRPVVDSQVGRENVLAEAQEEIVSESYGRALSAEGLRTVGQPDVGELDLVQLGQDYTYTAEVMLRPALSLSGIDDFAVSVPSSRASDREVDAQIEHTRERFATLEPVERPVEASDFALISFTGTVDGEAYEGNTVDRYLYELGKGLMPEEFDVALHGLNSGDSAVAEFVIPDTSSNTEFVGKQARFEIDVHEVRAKMLPDLDDAFASSAAGFDTFDEFREDVRAKLDGAKRSGHVHAIETAALRALVERLEGDVPDEMIETRASSMTREFFENLEERGIGFEQYVAATGVTAEQFRADMREHAEVRVREELGLEALFRAVGMSVTAEDVDEALLEAAGGDAPQAERLRDSLASNGALPIIEEQIMHRKALVWLMDAVAVTEEEQS